MTANRLTQLLDAAQTSRLVIKIGSALLVDTDGRARDEWLGSLVADIAAVKATGQDVILVSSGAIALGSAKIDIPPRGRRSLADAQAAAGIGQIELAGLWARALKAHGIIAAQMLVTLGDLEDRRRYLNASATLERLLAAGAVPIINENDSVATTEIRFGDNDRLAARVAQAARADGVILLSDVDGLYSAHPNAADAQLIEEVHGVDAQITAMADDSSDAGGNSGSGLGSGGMVAKLQAAHITQRAGITLAIVNGTAHAPLSRARKTGRGTVFHPVRSDPARKAWIGGMLSVSGRLTLDDGCIAALQEGGASLLPAGIVSVEGTFGRGDLVELARQDGTVLAQGLSEYDADEMRAVAGLSQDAQHSALGYPPRNAAVHRNQMVPLW